jgi:hypothetical protein
MRDLGRACVVSCFLLGATAPGFGVVSSGITDISDTEIVETNRPSPAPSAEVGPAVQGRQPPSGNPLWGIPIKQLSATRDRPIFSPSRRPPPPPRVDPPPVVAVARPIAKEPDRPRLSLLGTIVNGDDGFGIFMDQTTKAPLRIRIGAAYQGWTLRTLQPGSVTLVKGQESVVLVFPEPGSDEKIASEQLMAAPAARPSPPPPRLGLGSQTPTPYPSPQSTSLRAPARTSRNPALRQ